MELQQRCDLTTDHVQVCSIKSFSKQIFTKQICLLYHNDLIIQYINYKVQYNRNIVNWFRANCYLFSVKEKKNFTCTRLQATYVRFKWFCSI